jgi:hypothetical protein
MQGPLLDHFRRLNVPVIDLTAWKASSLAPSSGTDDIYALSALCINYDRKRSHPVPSRVEGLLPKITDAWLSPD